MRGEIFVLEFKKWAPKYERCNIIFRTLVGDDENDDNNNNIY